MVYSGKWSLRNGGLVIHWDGNGEHPFGLTTEWPVLEEEQNRFRLVAGEHGMLSYERVKNLSVKP